MASWPCEVDREGREESRTWKPDAGGSGDSCCVWGAGGGRPGAARESAGGERGNRPEALRARLRSDPVTCLSLFCGFPGADSREVRIGPGIEDETRDQPWILAAQLERKTERSTATPST